MKISPINSYPSQSFGAKKSYYITKEMLDYVSKPVKKPVVEHLEEIVEDSPFVYDMAKKIKNTDITYCEIVDGFLRLAFGHNGGYYAVKTTIPKTNSMLKDILVYNLNKNPKLFGGLLNYRVLVDDMKRQDIIQKGLRVHTYELNSSVPDEQAYIAAAHLSKVAKHKVNTYDLFFIDSDAFYYDKAEKTVYSINVYTRSFYNMDSTIRICKFETDNKGNAIGCKVSAMDLFQSTLVDKTYREQQEISEALPRVADKASNKLFAEAFRFGNMKEPNAKQAEGIKDVIRHMERCVGQSCTRDSLQFIRYYDKDKNIIYRIGCYNPSTGRSLIYNEDGKYMYEMQYIKDDFGKIIAGIRA